MRVTLRAKKLAYVVASAACLAGAATAVAWALSEPIAMNDTPSKRPKTDRSVRRSADQQSTEPTRDDFAKLWDVPLRRPLYDPPPPPVEIRQPPPLQVELLGTIIEGENSMAIVRSAQGAVEYKKIGESVGPAEGPASIVEIHSDSMVLERSAERITLGVRSQEPPR